MRLGITFAACVGHAIVFPNATQARSTPAFLFALQRERPNLQAVGSSIETGLDDAILSGISNAGSESKSWATEMELIDESGAAFHALFSGIRSSAALGVKGRPFHLKRSKVSSAMKSTGEENPFAGFFTFDDLAKAVEDDFLDAIRGSTDNRKGWKVTAVSTPRGSSFEDARMTLDEINTALEKGTVIINTAGSHIPKLAGTAFACCDASSLPCAVNLYVTAAGKRTSAPPHTDKQDVIVVQTAGSKRWRVYTPPDPSRKPSADMYARGKGDDDLPLYFLEEGAYGCQKLLDVTLNVGDVLFIPAAFPHTTDTVNDDALPGNPESASIHLTFNFDTHVWDLNYLSARRFALRRAGVSDPALGQETDDDNRYVGNVNSLPKDVRDDIFMNFPLTFLDEQDSTVVDQVTAQLQTIAKAVDKSTYDQVPSATWKETVERIRAQGIELLDIHRVMYLDAIEEGRLRKAEEAATAHLTGQDLTRARAMTPEKMQRLSLFRVKKFTEQINEAKQSLVDWSYENVSSQDSAQISLPEDWPFTLPLKVGDEVEADLGGAYFPATVTKAANNSYNVKYFDGDVMDGLSRDMIKLMNPPEASSSQGDEEEQPPPGLTKKEMKRWRKKQEKKKKKGN
mmetsp:Transcript_15856/g.23269  ORF Transcript_15856/g.23269 Transcript_15856/m.23269 type:complete len:626 (-) Transcript_15856:43-1920(-)|eukprot:CAMPEP_0195518320 /NCGR_PEP_ID=MMETSP0794_2-20130614/12676_1 /TAXON_ID=515487 /ORGANISM="Stephanopyxis turris, Strain CCMP 815" /LENGTH=625 /DNA_ID=CAMNT_0040647263 /DNA_START=59 /DNA_END=1936 /DNA_ORIENTATION=-